MNAYVNYFDTDGARTRADLQADDIRDDEMVVQFNESPHHWKMGLVEAQNNCDILNRANIHAKNRLSIDATLKWKEYPRASAR